MAVPTVIRRRNDGLCPKCGGQRDVALRIHCTDCLVRIRAEIRRREAEGRPPTKKGRMRAGKCYDCGQPRQPNRSHCPGCLAKFRSRYHERKAAGICAYCALRPLIPGKSHCEPCGNRKSAYLVARQERLRIQVMNAYGGPRCVCCGLDQMEFLTIDHIEGGGNQQRKQLKNQVIPWIIKNNFPPGFRVLCMNCNWAIGKYGHCPHQRRDALSRQDGCGPSAPTQLATSPEPAS